MSLVVLSSDVSGNTTVTLSSGKISSAFIIEKIIAVSSTGGNTRIRFTPLVGVDNDTSASPVSGSSLLNPSSLTDFLYLTMHYVVLPVYSPPFGGGHYLKALIVNNVSGARPVTIIFDIRFIDRDPVGHL